MNKSEFSKLETGDEVFTIHKGCIHKMKIKCIFDSGYQRKGVVLENPDGGKGILRHKYAIYNMAEK
jgi:hypothetical protein